MVSNKLNRIFLVLAAILIGTMFFSIAEALTVTLISPADESFTDDTTPDFTFNIADLTTNVVCDLLIDGSNYGSETVTDNGSFSITANSALNNGNYLWNIDCSGTSASQDREINIDTIDPVISLISPSNGEIFSSKNRRPDFTFSVTDNLDDSLDCDLYIDDATQSGWSATVDSGDTETISPFADIEWGKHEWYVKCVDEAGNEGQSVTRDFDMGGLEITDIDLSEDKVKPGEEITIDVDIKNILSDLDINDVSVTIENDELDIDEEDEINEIKDGDKETISFTVTIDEQADEDTYTIDIRVEGEDDDGYDHEAFGTVELEVEREKHELLIDSASFSPATIDCGKSTELTIKLINIGRNDEDDVYIIIKNNELGIEEKSEEFDVDKDDDQKESITIDIPENVKEKAYIFSIDVYYDDGDEKVVYLAQLNVNCKQLSYGADISVDKTSLDLRPNQEGEIRATLKNSGDFETDYEIILTGASTWSEYSITPSQVTLNPDKTENIIVHIKPDKDAIEGTQTVSLIVKHNGNTLASKSLKINVEKRDISVEIISEGETGKASLITGKSIFDNIEKNDLAIIIAILVVVVIIVASLKISRIPKK